VARFSNINRLLVTAGSECATAYLPAVFLLPINNMQAQFKARAGVLVANFFFGTSVIAVKHISPSLMPPFALTAVRVVVTMLLFWSMYALRPVKTGIARKDFLRLLFCAVFGITLNQTFTMMGFSLTSPIHASLLLLTTPITITLLSAWLLKETLTGLKIMGLLLGVSGGALLVFSRDLSAIAGKQQSLGDLLVVLSSFSYAIYAVSLKPLMAKYSATHILQWVFLFGTFFSLPIGWKALGTVQWAAFGGWDWFSLAYCILGATFIAYQLMNNGIKKLGASIAGSYIYTQPFFATAASILILHEALNWQKAGAAMLIMGGVFMANYKKERNRESAVGSRQ
jgi:drug/metabolite transporter (DMT)-like permease